MVFDSEQHELAVLLRHVDLLMTQARRNELARIGITPPQIGVLYFINKLEKPATVVQLRQLMLRSNSSLVHVLNRMEKKGLLKRQRDSESKKFTRISITEKGKTLYEKALSLRAFDTIVSVLSEEDSNRLRDILNTLARSAETLIAGQENIEASES